ncbi:hypothetical protein GF371_03595 [Candidatus Woesearchaeota archaeon]|nr:hypothetical protein [Candidatus Woesearchaeota archaeon]
MKLTRYNPNGPSKKLVAKVSAELGDIEQEIFDTANPPAPVNEEREEHLVNEISHNLERSYVNGRWRKGYCPKQLFEEDLGNGRYLMNRLVPKSKKAELRKKKADSIEEFRKMLRDYHSIHESFETDLRYFALAIKPHLTGEKKDETSLACKVKKLLEFKYNVLENHALGQNVFGGLSNPAESREIEMKVKLAMSQVDDLINLYIGAAPAAKKTAEEKIYLNRSNLEKLNEWLYNRIHLVAKPVRLELEV